MGRGDWRELRWGMGNQNTFDIVKSLWEQLVSWEEQGGRQEGEEKPVYWSGNGIRVTTL